MSPKSDELTSRHSILNIPWWLSQYVSRPAKPAEEAPSCSNSSDDNRNSDTRKLTRSTARVYARESFGNSNVPIPSLQSDVRNGGRRLQRSYARVFERRPPSTGPSSPRVINQLQDETEEDMWSRVFRDVADDHPSLRCFSVDEIRDACQDFSEENLIGQGSSAAVYLGSLDEEKVAIKRIQVGNESLKKFVAEVDIHSKLSHPNIVRLIGFCLDTEYPCMVTEYMSRGSLFQYLRGKNGLHLHWWQRFQIFHDICQGLQYLHSLNPSVIHRDLRPENILLGDHFEAKIADTGLAFCVSFEELGQSYVQTPFVGSVWYMDQEYLRCAHLSLASDIYSLGFVLLELLQNIAITSHPAAPSAYSGSEASSSGGPCTAPSAADGGDSEEYFSKRRMFMSNLSRAGDLRKMLPLKDSCHGQWPSSIGLKLLELGRECVDFKPDRRPRLGAAVLPLLNELQSQVDDLRESEDCAMVEAIEEKERRFCCPITKLIMADPVVASDGHTYERKAIMEWLSCHDTSPMTALAMENGALVPNTDLRSDIKEWMDTKCNCGLCPNSQRPT